MAIICPQNLAKRLWSEIKSARDEAEQQAQRERDRARRLNALLRMMINAGMVRSSSSEQHLITAETAMKTLEELERIKQAGPDLLEALQIIADGLRDTGTFAERTTTMTKAQAHAIACMAIIKATKP
jgi:hypothetical protein